MAVMVFNNVKYGATIDIMVVLSKAERKFLQDLRKGDLSKYTPVYKRQLKHNILKKRKGLTADLLLVNELLDKLQEL